MKLSSAFENVLKLLVFDNLKPILSLIIDKSLSCLLLNPQALEAMMPSNHHDDHRTGGNPASLVPVTLYFLAEAVKSQLPEMTYRSFLEKSGHNNNNNDSCNVCIVCLNKIELSHQVRVPFNCSHVFHRDCLDLWVDQGQGTCPLCRAKLLPIPQNQNQNHDHQGVDPYRRERMIYLFGDEDYLFGDHHQ